MIELKLAGLMPYQVRGHLDTIGNVMANSLNAEARHFRPILADLRNQVDDQVHHMGRDHTSIVTGHKPKQIREAVALAQVLIRNVKGSEDRGLTVLELLAQECDRHRPVAADGVHGDLHTDTCGCEDVTVASARPLLVLDNEEGHETHQHDRDPEGYCRGCDAEPFSGGPEPVVEGASLREQVVSALTSVDVDGYRIGSALPASTADGVVEATADALLPLLRGEQTIVASIVRGACPSCRRGGLAVGDEGHVYCTHDDCDNPRAADQLLRGEITHASGITYPYLDGDTYVRAPGVFQSEGEEGTHIITVDGQDYLPQRPPAAAWDEIQTGDYVEVSYVGEVAEIDAREMELDTGDGRHYIASHTDQGRTVRVLARPEETKARKVLEIVMDRDSCPQSKTEAIMEVFRDTDQ